MQHEVFFVVWVTLQHPKHKTYNPAEIVLFEYISFIMISSSFTCSIVLNVVNLIYKKKKTCNLNRIGYIYEKYRFCARWLLLLNNTAPFIAENKR